MNQLADQTRLCVGVSSCLLGNPVRYDGEDKASPGVLALAAEVVFLPFCPEVAIGLGVPRPPIQLVRRGDEVFALGVDDPLVDVTDALRGYAEQLAESYGAELHGYVFKARSPSCGLGTTPLFDSDSEQLGVIDGLFAGVLRVAWPGLPMVDEVALETAAGRNDFLAAVTDYAARQTR